MTTRLERVVLDLEDRFTGDMITATAVTAALRHELDRLSGTNVKLDSSSRKAEGGVRKLGSAVDDQRVKVDAGLKSIDKYSGRLAVMGDLLLALGPAAVTGTAVAIPAVAALGSEVGFLAVGLGTTMLAFHGVGDALTKFNKASLEPTATNIAAAQTAMNKLPPSAQRFVLELHRLNPELERMQRAAGAGLFPGLTAGLHSAQTDLPIVQRGLRGISLELGDLARDAGKALGSDQWRPFLRFVGQEAPLTLDVLGRSTGHVAHGLAELWMAFEPVNHGFDAGVQRLAEDFDRWATSLDRTKGFQDFLDYVQANGPRVISLLGQAGVTLVDVATAAAPLGGPVIDILDHILQIVDAIANSDFGTPIIGALLAFRTYARVAQLAGVQVQTSFKGMASAPQQVEAGITKLATSTKSTVSSVIADLRAMATEYQVTQRQVSLGGSLFPTGRTSNLAFHGLGDPFFNQADVNSKLATTTKGVGTLKSTVLSYLSGTSEAAQRTQDRLKGLAKGGAVAAGVAVVASGAADKVGLANTASLAMLGTLAGPYGAAVGGAVGLTLDLAHANDSVVDSEKRLQQSLSGSGAPDFAAQSQGLLDLTTKTAAYHAEIHDAWTPGGSHSLVGQLKEGALALTDLFNHTGDEADKAVANANRIVDANRTAFGQIFTSLGGPGQNAAGQDMVLTNEQLQRAATAAQPAMLALGITVDDLQKAAERGDGSLDHLTQRIVNWTNRSDSAAGRTDAVAHAFAAMSDQTLTLDDRIQGLSDALDALLGPGLDLSAARDQWTTDLRHLSDDLAKNKHALLDNSDAAIKNRAAIRQRVTDLEAMINAEAKAGVPASVMTSRLKDQRAALIDAGVAAGLSRKQLETYLNQLGLTPKAVRTAIDLVGVDQADAALARLTRTRIAHVDVVTRFGHTDTIATGGRVITGQAAGGTIPGQRHPYGDKVLMYGAPGEEVISNRYGQADRWRPLLKAINDRRYAGGGTVSRAAMTQSAAQRMHVDFGRINMSATISTPWGNTDLEGFTEAIAHRVYSDRSDADHRFEKAHG